MPLESPEPKIATLAPELPPVSPPSLDFPGAPAEKIVEPEPKKTAIRDAFAERGYDMSGFSDDDSLVPHLEKAYSQADEINQLRELAAIGRDALEQRERAKAPEKPDKSEKAPEKPESDWQPPEYNPQWEAICEVDPRLGRYVVREDWRTTISPTVAEKLTAYRQWEADNLRKMVQQFPDLVKKYAKEIVSSELQGLPERLYADVETRRTQSASEAYFEENRGDFYELSGSSVRIDASGVPALTEHGKKLQRYMQEFQDAGVTDHQKLARIALKWAKENPASKPEKKASAAKEPVPEVERGQKERPDDLLKRAIKQASHTPNRNAAAASADGGQPESFGAMLRRDMREAGFLTETG